MKKAASVWQHRPSCPVTIFMRALCVRPSIVSQRGLASISGQVDPDGHGYVPLNLTSNHTTLASTRHGSVCRTAQWRQIVETAILCQGAPLIMMMMMMMDGCLPIAQSKH